MKVRKTLFQKVDIDSLDGIVYASNRRRVLEITHVVLGNQTTGDPTEFYQLCMSSELIGSHHVYQ